MKKTSKTLHKEKPVTYQNKKIAKVVSKPTLTKLKRLLNYKSEIDFILEQERERIVLIIEADLNKQTGFTADNQEFTEHIRRIIRPKQS